MNEATAGGTLKYRIKRALEKSHSASDFREFKGIYDFTNYFLMVDREANK
nr:hypothetical protein [Helicobacter pylori]